MRGAIVFTLLKRVIFPLKRCSLYAAKIFALISVASGFLIASQANTIVVRFFLLSANVMPKRQIFPGDWQISHLRPEPAQAGFFMPIPPGGDVSSLSSQTDLTTRNPQRSGVFHPFRHKLHP